MNLITLLLQSITTRSLWCCGVYHVGQWALEWSINYKNMTLFRQAVTYRLVRSQRIYVQVELVIPQILQGGSMVIQAAGTKTSPCRNGSNCQQKGMHGAEGTASNDSSGKSRILNFMIQVWSHCIDSAILTEGPQQIRIATIRKGSLAHKLI